MIYFLKFQRMAGSENQVTIDEEAWKLVLPDQWNLTSKHEKAIRESLETFAHDINPEDLAVGECGDFFIFNSTKNGN